jgi:hypothetical protein
MNGYHVFYQSKEDSKYEYINYLVQLASILFWKKNGGTISLYCNSRFLNSLKKWGIDKLYHEINTDCLDEIPFSQYVEKYWSFCKIQAAKKISESQKEFVIIDTDLWIQDPIFIDNSFQLIGYHSEIIMDHPRNPYIPPDNFMSKDDLKLFDWRVNPINCAFMYFNSSYLIEEWFRWSIKTISNNKDKEVKSMSIDTIFIEQRLLPTIAISLGMKIGTILPNVYYPHIESDSIGSEWIPKVGFNEENLYMCRNIKHIWGFKKYYDDPNTRNFVVQTVCDSLNKFFPKWKEEYSIIHNQIV